MCHYEGILTDDEMLDAWHAAYAHPDWQPGMSELIDCAGLVEARITTAAIQLLADRSAGHFTEQGAAPRRSAVHAPGPLAHGLARMYGAFSEDSPEKIVIFDDLDDALAYLEIRD